MHLIHPTPSLVRSLQHSQRLERRKLSIAPRPELPSNGIPISNDASLTKPVEALGWVPPGMNVAARGDTNVGWQPPPRNDRDDDYEDSWKPSYG